MISHKNAASAVSGKTARACDSCIQKRARWYCAADDAFLCQSCDASVHSANPLARRHERVRLKTASLRNLNEFPKENKDSAPSWHRGFTKKARTPRHGKAVLSVRNPIPLVPEFGGDETSNEENEEQLLYRVPAYDPFASELCSSKETEIVAPFDFNETKGVPVRYGTGAERMHGFLPSDTDLAEFAADVESLLGKGLENESFGMEGLGLMDCDKERENSQDCSFGSEKLVKTEDEGVLAPDVGQDNQVDAEIDISKETFELNFDDYCSPTTCGEEEDEKVAEPEAHANVENPVKDAAKKRRKIFLKLDYESVLESWSSQGSPWTSGDRPDLNSDDYWPDCLGLYGGEVHNHHGELVGGGGGYGGHMGVGSTAGREAKVSRYREKRRTRLFSKKIRYEVRKLNAEKRPRMKGRFVKRVPFTGPTSFPLLSK
ncbi:zinc finger protein CONSTANS-LIKE 16-like [Punica granatum]|uniref:Uncharacterized protein n=2 Tax=Punica granatum TaxID=22663 RepID=A0A218WSD1_PUNGR|nr:zinc finger protein CONSTANS-LIKE 16-like [Punica granatum]OWM75774.1 hypothetical protein CDL15_Pgr009418 [Punica granatum]PKI60463.1 hypothetical protein CRG98_019117 [Punica granatum]